MSKSCVGCKFLYGQDTGYSNYTVEDTEVRCALDRNRHLPADEPYDWNMREQDDNWPATQHARCEKYSEGEYITLDVDDELGPADLTDDVEAIGAICADTGRMPYGHGEL